MYGHRTFLFGSQKISDAESGVSNYGHTFGGPHDRKSASRDNCNGILIHLLHRLNLEDPAIPIDIPGIKWLPLYYVFDFRANSLGYRLGSDETMEIFFPVDDPNVSDQESWPTDKYPMEFPQSNICVSPRKYDPTDIDDSYLWSGIFGIVQLSQADQETVKRRVRKEQEGFGYYPPETEDEFDEALSSPFPQGKPEGRCLNPKCVNSRSMGNLSVIALMSPEPVKGVELFGPYQQVALIFELCPKCHTICVSNQCD